MKNNPVVVLSGADTATITGDAFPVQQIVYSSFVPAFGDTTAAGTIKVQCSNDNPNITGRGLGLGTAFVPTNWADIPNATSTIVAGVGPAIVLPNMAFQYIRVIYTKTSGGSTTVIVTMSQLSA